jgi:phospholipid transport system substrate-binding protein
MKIIVTLCLSILLVATEPAVAEALGPMETLKIPVEKVIALLKDPQYNTPEKRKIQREKLFQYTGDIFDSVEISRRALGHYWRQFTPEERRKFTELFSKILKKTYSRKIQSVQEEYKVVWLGEKKLSATKAVVLTKVVRPSGDFPVDYRMRLKNNAWKVYDVIVEGISLVKNYRSQFNSFLVNKKPAALLAQLQKKVDRMGRE